MRYRRRTYRLDQPRPKLRLLTSFLAVAALALLLQHLLFSHALALVADALPQDGELLRTKSERFLATLTLGAFVALLPITLLIGIVAATRWTGPQHRLETFLRGILRGERPADVHLRKGDELQDVAQLVNQVTAQLRSSETGQDKTSTEDPDAPPAREAA
jgi:nitrogen fixation/metabolism regulation signal transduction histidine kinase